MEDVLDASLQRQLGSVACRVPILMASRSRLSTVYISLG